MLRDSERERERERESERKGERESLSKMRHARTSAWPHPDNAIERKGERARKGEIHIINPTMLRDSERERERERESERKGERESLSKMRHARTSAWPHPDNAIERKGERARKGEIHIINPTMLRDSERERERERESERKGERESLSKMRHARTSAWPHPDNAIERKGERARKRESLLVKCALLEPRHSPFQQCSR